MARLAKNPESFFILIGGEVMTECGNGGVIKSAVTALRLRDVLRAACPEHQIEMFGVFPLVRS